MLVLKENEDHFFKLQADMLLHGVKVVSYGDCFEQFPEYVQDLSAQICKQRSPGNVPSLTRAFPGGREQEATQPEVVTFCVASGWPSAAPPFLKGIQRWST